MLTSLIVFVAFRTYIAVPSSAWIDDYFEWSVEDKYCCRLHENGSFCRREKEEEEPEEEVVLPIDYDYGTDEIKPKEKVDAPDYVGGVDFEDFYDDIYNYDYTYGDMDIAFDHVEESRKKEHKKQKQDKKAKYEDDVYDFSKPLTGSREIPGDDGWPSNSKDPSETHLAHKKHHKAPLRKRSAPQECHRCPISPLPNNPFRPDPEVFNQYLPMFLKDNPDLYCPKAGHAAYGQVGARRKMHT